MNKILCDIRGYRFCWCHWLLIFVLALAGMSLACKRGSSPEVERLKIGFTHWPGFDVIFYAKQQGLFQKRGLEVELVRFENQQDASRAVMRGALDAAFVSLWDTIQVDPSNDSPVFVLVTNISHGADGIVAGPGIDKITDLAGKRVSAKLGTVNHLILLEALELAGMAAESVEVVDVDNELAVQQMKTGRIDAAAIWEPELSELAKHTGGKVIYTTREVKSRIIDGLFSRASLVDERQEAFVAFLLVWFDVMHAINVQPQNVYTTVAASIGENPDVFANSYAGLDPGDIDMNREMFEKGRLKAAIEDLGQIMRKYPQHGRLFRNDAEAESGPIGRALATWRSPPETAK